MSRKAIDPANNPTGYIDCIGELTELMLEDDVSEPMLNHNGCSVRRGFKLTCAQARQNTRNGNGTKRDDYTDGTGMQETVCPNRREAETSEHKGH
ncbi:unnamed protein product [Toxocara canis]|uniref:Transposase n=1 Tax=Toxocara canis TaxID=6265 RepID=A0A183UUE8_TOXCA|nr:unnamed protein product [Toxocara canis]